MSFDGEILKIDLSTLYSDDDLLRRLGAVFEFGGPEGNVRVVEGVIGKGWGFNWNAVADSLAYLTDGGIWGTSRIPKFRLRIIFFGCEKYRAAESASYAQLVEVFQDMEQAYAIRGLQVESEFQ